MFSDQDYFYMQHALQLAEKAASHDEVPVGAVLVHENKIIGEGWNQPISSHDPTAHAEIIALRQGATWKNNYRLIDTTLYVTLEPCMMCRGALMHARVKRVVFGAHDSKIEKCNHYSHYEGGLLTEICGSLLGDFFQTKRKTLLKGICDETIF